MCTAISFKAKDHYFGRNLDLYYNFGEQVIITPRKFPFNFSVLGKGESHLAIIGMATVRENYPLYYEGTNEKGLSAAALNFPKNAHYFAPQRDKINLAPFEFIPWLLANFSSVEMVEKRLKKVNIVDIDFSSELPNSPLHWMISDKNRSIVVESVADGLKIYENTVGVLTNNPPFDIQLMLLQNYWHLSSSLPQKSFSPLIKAEPYSLGMGAMGLPGDPSSPSRFIRAAFTKLSSVCNENETAAVGQFFHILGAVEQQKGVTEAPNKRPEYTLYSSCANTDKGIYYYTTYGNRSITAINMHNENLNGERIITFDLLTDEKITMQN